MIQYTIRSTPYHSHNFLLLLLLIQTTLIIPTTSFGSFKLPQWPFPSITKDATKSSQSRTTTLSPTDPILIIGGTGGVGQLTARKLLSRGFQNIRITTRDPIRAASLFDDDDDDEGPNNKPTFIEWDLVSPTVTDDDIISNIVSDAAAIIITTGTTAFPSQRWRGGNTPQAIDQYATERVMAALLNNNNNNNNIKKCLLVTSIGVERRSQMPFAFLNLFGVLDAKKKGEEAVINAAAASSKADASFGYVVIRPGRLVGGPYTNADIAGLLKIEGGAENGVALERGDTQVGDCKRDACAEAVVQSLLNSNCNNVVYSVITTEGKALSDDEWNDAFVGLGQ